MSTFVDNSTVVYTGPDAQLLIQQTFVASTTYETSRKMLRVRSVGKIGGLSASNIMGPAGCDFNEQGETAYENKEIRVYPVGISQEICEEELEDIDLASFLTERADDTVFFSDSMIDALNELYTGQAGEETEIALWQGVRGAATSLDTTINGFDFHINASAVVNKVAAPVAITDANVLAEMARLVAEVATSAPQMISKINRPTVAILVPPHVFQSYINARAATGNAPLFVGPEQMAAGVYFNGYRVEMRPGMANDTMVFCDYAKDLIVGTDTFDPKNMWKYIWMGDTTGDHKVRIISRYPLGTQLGREQDIVAYGSIY
jgi:hypothetical protein